MATPAQQLARELRTLRREVTAISRSSQMSRRAIEGGGVPVYDSSGLLRGSIGIQPDGTTAVVTVNDPTPPTPSAPIVEPTAGGLAIAWDGTFASGAAQPGDFRRVDVYTREASLPISAAVVRASLMAAGSATLTFPPDAYSVHFVTVTTGGSVSPASVDATETPAPTGGDGTDQTARDAAAEAASAAAAASALADTAAAQAAQAASDADAALTSADGKVRYITAATAPAYSGPADSAVWRDSANGYRLNRWNGTAWDVVQFGGGAFQAGAVTADLLAATAIDGKTVTGATLRTAASGQRIQIDSASGLVGYAANGSPVTTISAADGSLVATKATVYGEIGSAAGTGARVRLRQDLTDTAKPVGSVEFVDGITGSSPAQITQTADSQPRDSTSPFGRLAIKGGSYIAGTTPALVAAPEIDLSIEQKTPGVAQPVLRMTVGTGGAIIQNVATTPLASAALPLNATYARVFPAPYRAPYYAKLASGLVVLGGLINLWAASVPRGSVLATLPVGCRPSADLLVGVLGLNDRTVRVEIIAASGAITYVAPAAGDAVYAAGSYLTLSPISFLAEQ